MIDARLRRLLDSAASYVGLPDWPVNALDTSKPGEWLEGLVMTESGGEPRARRYEPHQDRRDRSDAAEDADRAGLDDGELEDDASYGLMQVMGYGARRLCGVPAGTSMRFGFLLLPITNISFGLRILTAELSAVAAEVAAGRIPPGQNVARALARYNGGPTGDDPDPTRGGDLRRREYVDLVAKHATAAQRDRRSKGWV